MTAPQIAPRIVDLDGNAEPFCSGRECQYYAGGVMNVCSISPCNRAGLPCIPGLRAQRDALQAERDAARRELCEVYAPMCPDVKTADKRGHCALSMTEKQYAAHRDWQYLYEEEGTK